MESVSVVIPVYNGSSFLPFSVASVAAQTNVDLELIIVDDGSTDDTFSVASNLISNFPFAARIIRHERNRGLSASRNTGIAAATGAWIQFLDCDDCISPCKLDNQMTIAKNTSSDVGGIYSNYQKFSLKNNKIELLDKLIEHNVEGVLPVELMLSPTYIHMCAFIYRTDVCKVIGGFNENFRLFEDDEFKIKFGLSGFKIKQVPSLAPTYLWRQYPDQPRWGGSEARYKIREICDNYLYCLRLALNDTDPDLSSMSDKVKSNIDEETYIFVNALYLHNRREGADYAKNLLKFYPGFLPPGPGAMHLLSKHIGFRPAANIGTIAKKLRQMRK